MNSINLPCSKPDLFKYTPHQSIMLLLDSIEKLSVEDSEITSSVTIRESSEFLDSSCKRMPVWVSFEYMAQSIAALSGTSHIQEGGHPKIGFIMGVRECVLEQPWFEINDVVSIDVSLEFRDGDIAVFKGKASVDGVVYCTAILSVIENSENLMQQLKDGDLN